MDKEKNLIGGKPNGGEPPIKIAKSVTSTVDMEQNYYMGFYMVEGCSGWINTGLHKSVDEVLVNLENATDVTKARIVQISLPPPFQNKIDFV
jgi:hypothetical protein